MHGVLLTLALLPVLLSAQAENQQSVWAPLTFFMGEWEGTATSRSGMGTATRQYRLMFNGAFINEEVRHVYDPSTDAPEGETHEEIGFFSYDRERKTFVLRQFHSEGLVAQYVLDSLSADSTTIVFISESIENAPPGWRAMEQYEIINDDEFIELFKLAPPGGEFEAYWETHLTRKDQ